MAWAQAQAGDPAAARATLQRAIAHASDARALLAIEQVQAKMGDRDAALKTLLMARNSDLVGPQLRNDQVPGVIGQVEPPDPELAARVANWQIPKTLADIAIEQSRLGDRAAAEATFEQAMRAARTLEPDERRWAIVQVIAAQAEAGDFDTALKEVASIADRAERFEALTQIHLRDRVVDTKVLGGSSGWSTPTGSLRSSLKDSHLSEVWVTRRKDPAPDRDGAGAGHGEQSGGGREDLAKGPADRRGPGGGRQPRYAWLGKIARALVKMEMPPRRRGWRAPSARRSGTGSGTS